MWHWFYKAIQKPVMMGTHRHHHDSYPVSRCYVFCLWSYLSQL